MFVVNVLSFRFPFVCYILYFIVPSPTSSINFNTSFRYLLFSGNILPGIIYIYITWCSRKPLNLPAKQFRIVVNAEIKQRTFGDVVEKLWKMKVLWFYDCLMS